MEVVGRRVVQAQFIVGDQMRIDYFTLFDDGKFRGRNFFQGGWSCNTLIFKKRLKRVFINNKYIFGLFGNLNIIWELSREENWVFTNKMNWARGSLGQCGPMWASVG